MGRVSILLTVFGKETTSLTTLTFFVLVFPLALGRYFGSGVAIIIFDQRDQSKDFLGG